ncbi:MAG: HNH endonuclease [Rhodospirillales bacterium]|nr:HNH endonuclease [Rhodospirillales bacterium]
MFGEPEGIKVGQLFDSRRDLANAGVHKPFMSGIWGAQGGAYSIVLSGGYEDDIDELDYILYTGQGGQDTPGGKQVADQEFIKGNRGLQLSCQYSLPVRVTRGHQIKNGPQTGYRYDGLYYVKNFERIRGQRGFYICRFHLISESNVNQLETVLSSTLKPTYERTPRSETTVNRLKRNVAISEKLKSMYEYQCQICDVTLDSPSGPIAIGAHIKGLGNPHNGPDVIQNMLCLCPNHHDQFDYFSYFIDPNTFQVIGLIDFNGKKINIHPKHKIDTEFLEYHKEQYLKNN